MCVLTGESSHTASVSSAAHMRGMHDSSNASSKNSVSPFFVSHACFSANIDLKIIFGYCHVDNVSVFQCSFSIYICKIHHRHDEIIRRRAVFLWCASPMSYSHASSATTGYEHNSQDKILFPYPSSALVSAIAPPSTKVPILLFERSKLS